MAAVLAPAWLVLPCTAQDQAAGQLELTRVALPVHDQANGAAWRGLQRDTHLKRKAGQMNPSSAALLATV